MGMAIAGVDGPAALWITCFASNLLGLSRIVHVVLNLRTVLALPRSDEVSLVQFAALSSTACT